MYSIPLIGFDSSIVVAMIVFQGKLRETRLVTLVRPAVEPVPHGLA